MTLGVRGKLFAISLLLMLLVGLGSGLYLENVLTGWLNARIEAELLRQARMARDLLELAQPASSIQALDPVADRVGASIEARISIIAPDGSVLGDSRLDPIQLENIENHAQRPEILAVLAGGHGVSRRYSTSLGMEMLYVAMPYGPPEHIGIVRIAMPLSELNQTVERLRLLLLLAGLLGLGLAVLMSALVSQLATRAMRKLVASVRAVIRGEGDRRIPVATADELGWLAGSFNRVVAELDSTVTDLAGERDHLETILDSMSEGVLALDAGNRVSRLNRAALELLALDDSSLSEPVAEAIRVPALLELAYADPVEQGSIIEFDLPGSRHIEANAAPLRTGGRVLVLRDATGTKRLENIRRDFVANVSHELRTPVSVIRANAETLIDGAVDDRDRAKMFLEAVYRNADRLAKIIADLLDLSRIEAGEYAFETSIMEIEPVLQHVFEMLREAIIQKELTFDIDIPDRLQTYMDARAMEQIIFNIIDNAVKYTGFGGHIAVRAGPDSGADGSVIRLEIEDNGPGIGEHHRERIFERFYRVDPSRSREMGGTGLGLSIVKHLVDSSRGAVGFKPASPHGSIFWVTMPGASQDPDQAKGRSKSDSGTSNEQEGLSLN